MAEKNDHDMLIELTERVRHIDGCLTRHLNHHWAIAIALFSAIVMSVIGLICAIVRGV